MNKVQEMYAAIPDIEKNMIADWIADEGALYSGVKTSPAPLEHVLRFWGEAKYPFYKMFGDRLTISKPIDYEAPLGDLRHALSDGLTNEGRAFFHELSGMMRSEDHPVGRALRNAYLGAYLFFVEALEDMLIRNRWEYDDVKLPLDNGKVFVIKNGMRITRIFQKLADLYNIKGYEAIRELHAKVSTARYIRGTICLTIHPLDYMTMSDNEEGWDSCMNWRDNGDYRAGTVEMLNSPVIIEAYIPSVKNKMKISGHEWNSKMWRELYIVTPDMISNIRAYPFLDINLSKKVVNWIRELAEQAGFGIYRDTMSMYGDTDDEFICKNQLELRIECNNMYNDFCREDQCIYFSTDFAKKYQGEMYYLNYSGVMECMNCGNELSASLDETRAVMCGYCSDDQDQCWVCDCCGNEVYDEDDIYEIDGSYVCRDCIDDPEVACVAYDDDCTHLVNNCTEVYLGDPVNGRTLFIYDLYSYLRKHPEQKKILKRVNPSSPFNHSERWMISAQDVTLEMARAAGYYDMADFQNDLDEAEIFYEICDWPMWL